MKRSPNHNKYISRDKPHIFLKETRHGDDIFRSEMEGRFIQWSNLPMLCRETKLYFKPLS